MSKALKTAALVVGAVAFAATVVASGGATLGLAPGVIALAEGVATVATLGTLALEVGSALLAPKPTSGGSATKFKADPLAGIPYVMGRTINAGNIIYRRTYNTPGYSLPDLQSFVVDLSGAGPIDGIERFWSDKPTAVYDATNTLIASTDPTVNFDSSGNALGFFSSWMWQTTQLGATPTTSVLAKTYGGTLPPDWSASSKLSGHAAAMWTLRYDQKGKVYTNGVPEPAWILRGVKIYDPRLDSTYPGGSGPCRAGVESTYVYSENPYLHGLTWVLGRYQNGKRILGVGAPIMGIDVAAFVEGANVADANGWKVGGVMYSTDNKWNVLKTILQAGGGEPMHLGARISCFINTPRVVLDTVTYADVAGEVSVAATKPRRYRINAITGTYRSEAHQWEVIPASPIQVDSYVTADGGLRMKNVDYPLVQNLTQMAQLVRYDIENAREFEPISLPLKLRWLGYKPGDCIAVTLPENGLNAQPVLIRNRALDAETGLVTLTGRSETAAKHPFALGQTGVAPPTPTVTGPPLIPVPADGAWAIGAVGLTTGNSTTPALVVTGSASGVSVDGIVFEYRLYSIGQADGAGWIATGGPDVPTSTRKEITALLPGVTYEAAVSYQLGATTGARRILGPVITAGVAVSWSGVAGSGRPEDGATSSDNLILNAGLLADTSGYVLSAGITRSGGGSGDPVANYLLFQPGYADASAVFNNNQPRAVTGGETLFLSGKALRGAGSSGVFTIELYFINADGGSSPAFIQTILPAADSTWTPFAVSTVVPVNAVSFIGRAYSNLAGSFAAVGALRLARTQSAADVTRQNTANDTAHVAGQDAATFAAAAATAYTNAAVAIAQLADIASDNLLTPGEKPTVILDKTNIDNEQAGIDAQATAFGITTEKAAYDAAVTALTSYLAGLTSPTLWSTLTGNTTIVGTTFRAKFASVYSTRQTLLDQIATIAATRANWASVTGAGKSDDYATSSDNLVANASLANGAAQWFVSYATLDGGHAGTPIANFFTFTANGVFIAANNNLPVPIGSDKLYSSVYVYRFAGSAPWLIFYWYKADGSASSTPSSALPLNGTINAWTIVEIDNYLVPPADASGFVVRVVSLADGVFYAGGVRVARTQSGATLGANRRNIPQTFGGGVQLVYSVDPLSTSTDTSGVATITIAAHTVADGLGSPISYAAGSITGLAASTRYAVYEDDPTYAGGTRTYLATTTFADLAATSGRRVLGYITTASAGSTGSGSTGGGAGGGGRGGGGGGTAIP